MLFVGLGNPGSAYSDTRHNIGFMVIDELLRRHSHTSITKSSFKGELFKSNDTFFLKPTTYMNLSGESIIQVKNFYNIEQVAVIHDDLDLPFGALRIKFGGGHGGHNGLKSADAHISREYIRLRMGIGKPEHKGEVASYVLSPFSANEQELLSKWISHCADACDALMQQNYRDVAAKFSLKSIDTLL